MVTLVQQDKIAQTSGKQVNYTTMIAQFGDGYMQRAGDGINKKKEVWTILYDNLNQTERDILWVFIEQVQMSDVIEWTAPGDLAEKKWIIDPESTITEQAKAGALYSVTLTLKRVFDL